MARLVLTLTATIAVALSTAVCSQSEDQQVELFKGCREAGVVPGKLKETYTAFTAAARRGKVTGFTLPGAITVSTTVRPEKDRDYGRDMNLPFLKNQFSAAVLYARRDSADCLLLRTATTALWFVETKSGEWRIYRYLDKPIE